MTILLNTLGIDGVNTLADLNAFLQKEGLVFNRAGGADGLSQGSRGVSLEQSSTIADQVAHRFACGQEQQVPCSFLELIQRHDGFRGFLGQNAKGPGPRERAPRAWPWGRFRLTRPKSHSRLRCLVSSPS